jgi:GNAT superfamily N-acetyltransferase
MRPGYHTAPRDGGRGSTRGYTTGTSARERRSCAATQPRALGQPSGHSVPVDAEALVRSPEITDAQQIARTMNDSWRVGYRGLLSDAILDGLDDVRGTRRWVRWLRHGYENAGLRAEFRVATDAARQIVGVSGFGADRDLPNDVNRGELWTLYVAPSHWGRGFGYALLRDAEEALAATGRRDLALWVLEGNDRARRFYERAGWRADDGMKPFGDSGLREMRYRKQV